MSDEQQSDEHASLYDVTLVLKSGVSHTFRMKEFSFKSDSLGKSFKWKDAPGCTSLLTFEADQIAMVFATEVSEIRA
jgi:hypothetical protein